MKLLTFSTLYPNSQKPAHGIFVETRLRHLVATGGVETRVVAPVPWFPSQHSRFGKYATFAKVPLHEMRSGFTVAHPRYPLIPKVGMSISPLLLAVAVKPAIRKIIKDGYDFDVIDAHYFYPDGVAAVILGQYFNKPVVITARGTDISLIPQYLLPRKWVLWACKHAHSLITVCNALKNELIELGVSPDRITTLRNGVDLELFKPANREKIRASLAIDGFTLLSVGHLVPVKGHEVTISALPLLPGIRLFIAGSGPDRPKLEALAKKLNVHDRITFLGSLSQQDLQNYYNAADALVLASSREGWANVLLESMACGTPVIASNVWGTPEVVAAPEAGLLMAERTPDCLAKTVNALRARYPDRAATRRYAEGFDWQETSAGQLRIFQSIKNTGNAAIKV